MIITPLDYLLRWFSKLWELRDSDKFVWVVYLCGIVAAFLILPFIYLLSWVIQVDMFELRNYVALALVMVCWYFLGSAVALCFYRRNKGSVPTTDKVGKDSKTGI